jgi:diguanylate cyclase (GGDEF)-like protein
MDSTIDQADLMGIIEAHTEIAKVGVDVGAVMNIAADRAMRLTGADGSVIELAEGEDMVYRAVSGIAAPSLGLRLKRSGSLSGLCVEQGKVLACDDCELDERVDRDACRRVGLRSMVVAPLDHEGTTLGVLKILSRRQAAFGARETRILELMTELVAAALFHGSQSTTDELFYRATHDHLTGLANRAFFFDRLLHHLAVASRNGTCVGILNLDLDGLKSINDSLGHRFGDAAICEAARRIASVPRESDSVARLGGDEFAVALSDMEDRAGAERLGARIEARLREPFEVEGHAIALSASVGVAMFPEDGEEIERLLEAADMRMYAVKKGRKDRDSGLGT